MKQIHQKQEHTGSYYAASVNEVTDYPVLEGAKTADVCENIKDEGIRLYTITFKVSNSATQALMEECATSPALYFDSPSNEQLEVVFQAIARDLSNLRLSR